MQNMACFIKIAAIENVIEAQILESILEERNIPYRIRYFYDTAYDGSISDVIGMGRNLRPSGE